jgi:hypothetical protein
MLWRRRLEFPVIIYGSGGGSGSAARLTPLITIIFETESGIQVFTEIIHCIDKKKKNLIFFVDKNQFI